MSNQILVQVDADLKDLIPNFLTNRDKEAKELELALKKSDFEALRIIGHNMKGVGGGYGFGAITDLGQEIENAAKERDDTHILDCLMRYRAYLSSVNVVFV
jgi:HPt (histidine-containing phosphotransfer) domain-containing protein